MTVYSAWKLASCRRCQGDMLLDTDNRVGKSYQCIQCGYVEYVQSEKPATYSWNEIKRRERSDAIRTVGRG